VAIVVLLSILEKSFTQGLHLPCLQEDPAQQSRSFASTSHAPSTSGTKRERREVIVWLMFPENEAADKRQKFSIVVASLNDGARLMALILTS
jgi:hypothetical protein